MQTIFAQIDRPVNALQLCPESIHTKKLCSRLSLSKVHFFDRKRPFCIFEPQRATHAVHLRLIGKLIVDFLLVIIELFR